MKKLFLLLAIASLFSISCNNKKDKGGVNTDIREKDDYRNNRDDESKDDSDKSSKWSSSDVRSFNNDCHRGMKDEIDEDQLDKFCSCMLEKFQDKFSSFAEFNRQSTEEDGISAKQDCKRKLTGSSKTGGWSASEVSSFIDNCIPEAIQKGLSRTAAKNYCSCMQEKLERRYPDVNEIANMSENEMIQISARYAKDCIRKQ